MQHPGAPSEGRAFSLLPQIVMWAAVELLAEHSPASFQMLNCIHSFGKCPDREPQSSHLWEEEVGKAEQCLCPADSTASTSRPLRWLSWV